MNSNDERTPLNSQKLPDNKETKTKKKEKNPATDKEIKVKKPKPKSKTEGAEPKVQKVNKAVAAEGKKSSKEKVAPIKKSKPDSKPVKIQDDIAATPIKVKKITAKVIKPDPISAPVSKQSDQNQAPDYKLNKITFQLRYHTNMGEQVYVTGNHELLGNGNFDNALALNYLNEDYWFGEMDINDQNFIKTPFQYRYFVKQASNIVNIEHGGDKIFDAALYNAEEVRLIDAWNDAGYYENTFFTEPFKNVLLKNNLAEVNTSESARYTHIFKIKAPLLSKNEVVNLYGSADELGKWDVTKPVKLSRKQGDDYWTVKLDLSKSSYPITYKYGIAEAGSDTLLQLETGKNRVVYDGAGPGKLTVVSDGFTEVPKQTFKGAGVAIPVFSLRSKNSLGVGEFADINLLVDWAKNIGLKVIQILPVNDTIATHSWVDSYPYAAISAFALHPIFLHLPAIVSSENQSLINEVEDIKNELNKLDKVDYENVLNTKLQFVQKIFNSQKSSTFKQHDFTEYFKENKHWLVPYAAFSYLRDEFGTPEFTKWPENSTYNEENIQQLAGSPLEAKNEISIHYFIQFHLHLQLKAATEYAHTHGIIVKGDIPIGIYRNSADAWQEPGLYNMDKQAGAPPDDFAIKGQNWGFPTYNWQAMQQDGFAWWKKRFAQMKYYFDAFRIDHILGFFRIWSIPMHAVEGIMGNFVPAVPLHKYELESYGIYTDTSRFTQPYINDTILWEMFGDNNEFVKRTFLNDIGYGHYALKEPFNTQRKVDAYIENASAEIQNSNLKNNLFDLVSNVIMFEAEGAHGEQFHFRIGMENTASFRFLDGDTQNKLKDLYVNYFFRRQDNFWREEAMHKLPELKRSTNMLICGEDLGMVPDCVPGVMNELGILSLEIQRMPKDPKREFFHPNDAPYLSVVTPSTHDMSTIRGWWEEDPAKTQRFYNQQLGKWGSAPFFCEPELNTAIVVQHIYSPAMWSIFQLQDLFGMDGAIRRNHPADERINVPANPKHYWQYRMHVPLEDLLNEEGFNSMLRNYIVDSGRS